MLKSLLKNITFNKTQKKKRKYLPVSFEFGRKIEESSLAVHGTVNHLCSGNLWEALRKGKPVNTSQISLPLAPAVTFHRNGS